MLSEKHEAEFIEYWIRTWLRSGAMKPAKAVSDYSRALLLAMCLAFNNITLKSYIQRCFAHIKKSLPVKISTHIRVDVAHLIHLVSRWKCFKLISHLEVKQFFLRCVALMIETSDLQTFERIFTLTCTVAVQKYNNSMVKIYETHSVQSARIQLEKYIGRYTSVIECVTAATNTENVHLRSSDDEETPGYFNDGIESEENDEIVRWIDKLLAAASSTEKEGNEINAFYNPKFITSL